jgi:hypothetical protein
MEGNMATAENPSPDKPSVECPLPAWGPWVIFGVLLALFLAFPTRTYDGDALKRVGIMFGPPTFEGSNHPFTNGYFAIWWNLVKGFAGTDVVRRLDALIAMNSLFGAAAAAFGCAWLGRIGVKRNMALLGGLALGLTSASVYHSTQTTEPISAQFWFMLSLYLGTFSNLGKTSGILSGACWAAAVASYQSYFLVGPFALWIHCRRWRDVIPWTVAAGAVGFFLFGLAAHLNGQPGISGFIKYLTTKHDGDYWGFFTLGQTVRVPLGFSVALANPWPLSDWPGLLAGFNSLSPLWKVLCPIQILTTWVLVAAALLTKPQEHLRRFRWPLALGFAACTFPPLYLSPQYWKLWLLPVSLIQLLGILVAASYKRGPAFLVLCLTIQVACNVPRILVRSHNPNSGPLNTARALSESIKPSDLLICDAWGEPAMFCATNPGQKRLNLMNYHDGPAKLWSIIRDHLSTGNRVFLYGVVDRSKEKWNVSDLGTRPNLIKFDELQPLREILPTPVWTGTSKGTSENLYQLLRAP